jgi:hypothetical protein
MKTAQSGFVFLRTVPRSPKTRDTSQAPEARSIGVEAIHVPTGTSFVSINQKGRARITKRPPKHGQAFVLEAIGTGPQSAVLVFPMPGHQVHTNGMPTPLVATVRPKDRLQFDGSVEVLHGTRHIDNSIGPLPQDAVGTKCPICRSAFHPESRVWLCRCGQPLHLEPPSKTAGSDEPLQCAMFTSTCPNCSNEVAAAEDAKYTYIPTHFRSLAP